MLKLKNIKLTKGIISAEYEPESAEEAGRISIDADSGDVVEQRLAPVDEMFPMYFNKALEWLQKIRTSSEIPKEKMIMWY